jgi:hypothetical protein
MNDAGDCDVGPSRQCSERPQHGADFLILPTVASGFEVRGDGIDPDDRDAPILGDRILEERNVTVKIEGATPALAIPNSVKAVDTRQIGASGFQSRADRVGESVFSREQNHIAGFGATFIGPRRTTRRKRRSLLIFFSRPQRHGEVKTD